jgi:CheY-like chemotaxis protein
MTPQIKILLVEDQKYPLEALEYAVRKVAPNHYDGFAKSDYDVAKCFNKARELLESTEYGLVLLDNRMPYEDQGDLEDKDMRRFSESLHNLGYTLIPEIKRKNPKTIVIGTSSLSKDELRGLPSPDFTMSKMWGEAQRDLEEILEKMKGGNC